MNASKVLWRWYLAGAILTLVWKWASWVYTGKKQHSKKVWDSTKEWFSIELFEAKISWITTFAVVWVFGAAYINDVHFWWTDWIKDIPAENSIAFLFGSVMELLAPAAAKWVFSKLPFGTSE